MNKKNFIAVIFCTIILLVGFIITITKDNQNLMKKSTNISEGI